MFHSLRARLLAWSALLVLAALVVVGAGATYTTWDTWIADVDRDLAARLDSLRAAVQPFDDGAVDVTLPPDAITMAAGDYYAVWNAAGRLLVASDPDLVDAPPAPGRRTENDRREHSARLPGQVTVLVGHRIDDLVADIGGLRDALIAVGAAALLLVIGGGWWLIGLALEPVRRIGDTARAMIDGDLTARIPARAIETELGQLADVLNDAFDRLYASLERQQRFTADASHDLRTPLATLRAETEWALSRPRDLDELRASLAVCDRAGRRMQTLVTALLELARTDRVTDAVRTRCPLPSLIDDIVTDLKPTADRRGIVVRVTRAAGDATADPVGLRTAIGNLVANAIEHNVEGGWVEIDAAETADPPGGAEIVVRDGGPGIDSAHAPRIFDRFYRADSSRTGHKGSGLGLAIVATFAERHGGSVQVEATRGGGATFRLRLPGVTV